MTIQMIPLNRLRLSEHNVRKSGAEDNLEELEANIEANGVLQNLVGTASRKKGYFDIFVGGRRWRALNRLAARAAVAKDVGVPVEVLEGATTETISEISLAENFIRLQMTPTDECRAFLHFLGTDGDIDGVAKRFHQTRRFVEGRIRLASLAPEIFAKLEAGEMTMEIAKAYATTADHVRQMSVFSQLEGSYQGDQPYTIRRAILGSAIPGSHPIALLVGLERYMEAGGRVDNDLFADDETSQWLDADIATLLASDIMKERAVEAAAELGVATVVPVLTSASNWQDQQDLIRAPATRAPLSEDAALRLMAIEEEREALYEQSEIDESDEEGEVALTARLNALTMEEADLRNTGVEVDEAAKPFVTQFMVIGTDGQPAIESTCWVPRTWNAQVSDDDTLSPAESAYVPPTPAAQADGLSARLADELAMQRRDILAVHLAGDSQLALDVTIFLMACTAATRFSAEAGSSLAIGSVDDPFRRNQIPPSAAHTSLEAIGASLNRQWIDARSMVEKFDAFRALDDTEKASWLAYAMASSLKASIGLPGDQRASPFHNHLGQLLAIDVAGWWRPDAANYFGRIKKAKMLDVLATIGGDTLRGRYSSAKSGELAEACSKICSGTAICEPEIREAALAWVPDAMRFEPATAAISVEDTPVGIDDEDAAAGDVADAADTSDVDDMPTSELVPLDA